MCKHCELRGKPWKGDNPICAFKDGVFTSENWNCATMNRLRDVADNLGTTKYNDLTYGSIGYVPFEGVADSMDAGCIVMSWYKQRGRTGQALVMLGNNVPRPLTELEALEALRQYEDPSYEEAN